MGRTGTPPATESAIKDLPEIEITDKDCKHCDDSNNKEYPRCSICCEDLTEKATKMPCGHLFNQGCISEWLKQHNQCPVCRYELPTDDAEYESRKRSQQQSSSSPTRTNQWESSMNISNQTVHLNIVLWFNFEVIKNRVLFHLNFFLSLKNYD